MKKLFLFVIIAGLAITGLVAVLRGPAREFTASLFDDALKNGGSALPGPSFTDDKDSDGLSDAKEAIYGTNAAQNDTDGDGYKDGEEVTAGFDPTTPGQGKISDNQTLMSNLSVRYFEWARTVGGATNPQLNDQAVQQFLETEGLLEAQIPTIADNELLHTEQGGPEAVRAYLDALAQIKLPAATGSYVDLADEIIREKQSAILDDVVLGLDLTYRDIAAVPTPPEAIEIQRGQLAMLKALKNLFVDLYTVSNDPVKLVRDIAWGGDILEHSLEVEVKRRELGASVAVTPSEENE